MNLTKYTQALFAACERARRHDPYAVRRFWERHRWLFSGVERAYVTSLFGAFADSSVAYAVMQERRAAQNDPARPADPDRMSTGRGAAVLGLRSLMFPAYFRTSNPRERSRVLRSRA